jgi:hypothetical protein
MPALAMLAGALGLNYILPTICSTCRRYISAEAMTAIVLGAVSWFIPHYWRGFPRAVANVSDAIATAIEEATP